LDVDAGQSESELSEAGRAAFASEDRAANGARQRLHQFAICIGQLRDFPADVIAELGCDQLFVAGAHAVAPARSALRRTMLGASE